MRAAEFLREKFGEDRFEVAVVGGSGINLGSGESEIGYSEVPGMPTPKVPGHSGRLKKLKIGDKRVLFFEGRFHYYEGRSDREIRFIPELSSELGVKLFILTCSSGAVSRRAVSSEIGVVYDHVNFTGRNPLVGLISEFGERVFFNPKELYDREFSDIFLKVALSEGIRAVPVVLGATLGPSYETFSEVRLLQVAGADCVSMSTVPEALVAGFLGMRVVALTVFTNDVLSPAADHKEVLKVASERSGKLSLVLRKGIEALLL